jgi:hypothetical protein
MVEDSTLSRQTKSKLMARKRKIEYLLHTVMCGLLLIWFGTKPSTGQVATTPPEEAKNAAGFEDFMGRVQAYVNLRKAIASSLSALKPTDQPEKIANHQQTLAQKIREARRHARRGDIFSEEARNAFRRTVHEEFGGPHGHRARTTIRQGEPLKTIRLHVNEPYPDGVPYTTLPPTLLLKFPKLPDQVAYRIVGRDLILLDVEANLVIDRIPDIFPETI